MNGVLIFNFVVNFTYSGVFIVKIEHIPHLLRREKCRNTCFILEKKKQKVSLTMFNRLQIKDFSSRI